MPPSGDAATAPASTNENDGYTVPQPIAAPPVPVATFPDLARDAEASKQEAKANAETPEETAAVGDSGEELTGDALAERARDLDIKGRSSMDADELRAAIAETEAAKAAGESA